MILRATIAAVALGLAGCGSVLSSDSPPERVYWLEPLGEGVVPLPEAAPATRRRSLGLYINTAPGLDTDRLLVLEGDARLNEYAAARWPDRAAAVISHLLKASIESNSALRVNAPPANPFAGYLLELELRRFFVQAGSAQLEIEGYLRCQGDVHPISARASAPIADERLSIIVAAFQTVLDDASTTIIQAVGATDCFQDS